KAELRESATNAGKGVGMLGAGAYAGGMAVLFLSIALWAALTPLVGGGLSGVIVAVIWGVIALILFMVGRSHMKRIQGMPQTVKTMQEFPDAFHRNEENQ